MPIEIGVKKPPLGECPDCLKKGVHSPLREFLGMIRCSNGRCDYVKPDEKAAKQREEAKIQTAEALLAEEERGRPRLMDLLKPKGDGEGQFIRDMVDESKDPMENGKTKKEAKKDGTDVV